MNKGEVYITYENSTPGLVTGVYANKKLAEKEISKSGDILGADTFEIKGYNGYKWDYPLDEDCKYYKPHMNTIRELISCLYQLEGCCCGGLAHIVTDDNNIEDHFLKWVLEQCDEEENKDRTERGLVKLICEELLQLSIQERVYLFSHYYHTVMCGKKCCKCHIAKGDVDLI